MDLLWSATYHSQVSDGRARGRACEYSNILILYSRIFSGESIAGKFISQLSRELFLPQPILMARQKQSSNINFVKRQFKHLRRWIQSSLFKAPSVLILTRISLDVGMLWDMKIVILVKTAAKSWFEFCEMFWDAWAAFGSISAIVAFVGDCQDSFALDRVKKGNIWWSLSGDTLLRENKSSLKCACV